MDDELFFLKKNRYASGGQADWCNTLTEEIVLLQLYW